MASAAPIDLPESSLLEGRAALRDALLEALLRRPRVIALSSYALESALYGSEAFVEALKQCLLSSEQAHLRVLLNQPRLAVQNAPRLLDLMRRLPSRIESRVLDEADRTQLQERLIAAPDCVIERSAPEALQAHAWLADTPTATRKREAFDALWLRAVAASELRSLGL